jgi:hypothetical protein
MEENWSDLKRLLKGIKEDIFQSGVVDVQKPYSIQSVERLRLDHHTFRSVEKGAFFSLFKRAHAEWLLKGQLEEHYNNISKKKKPQPQQHHSEQPQTQQRQRQQHQRKKNKQPSQKGNDTPHQRSLTCGRPAVHCRQSSNNTMTKLLKLPTTIVKWKSAHNNMIHDRIHVFIHTSSGLNVSRDIQNIKVQDGNQLVITLQWPPLLLQPDRIFKHRNFDGHYEDEHPKVIAFAANADKLIGEEDYTVNDDSIVYQIVVDLPGDYDFTKECVSGHHFFEELVVGETDATKAIFWLIDLTKKEDGRSITKPSARAKGKFALQDDLEID